MLEHWLTEAVQRNASDLHLVADHPPIVRIHGELEALQDEPLSSEHVAQMLLAICPDDLRKQFHDEKNADFSYEAGIAGAKERFRVNLFINSQHVGSCFRLIPRTIPEFGWAGFPRDIAERLAGFRNGLVLFSGVTGSGKTTSLAMIMGLLNQRGGYRIITIEEPIEYVFPRVRGSLVTQREVGADVPSFADGLKYGLRQDPDIILVGEIRDQDTAQIALSAAETGHLVFSTVHTRDAKGAISRYADLFPQSAQQDVRSQLALSLRAVVSQHLLPSSTPGEKRELALEILYNTSPVSSAIRFGKLEGIDNSILTGRADGMVPLDVSIRDLYHAHRITRETALQFVSDPRRL